MADATIIAIKRRLADLKNEPLPKSKKKDKKSAEDAGSEANDTDYMSADEPASITGVN